MTAASFDEIEALTVASGQSGTFTGAQLTGETIVLTGAMIPYEIRHSDALFNLGFACGVAQTLPVGVYIAMNGQVFDWDKVQKNTVAGVFQPN